MAWNASCNQKNFGKIKQRKRFVLFMFVRLFGFHSFMFCLLFFLHLDYIKDNIQSFIREARLLSSITPHGNVLFMFVLFSFIHVCFVFIHSCLFFFWKIRKCIDLYWLFFKTHVYYYVRKQQSNKHEQIQTWTNNSEMCVHGSVYDFMKKHGNRVTDTHRISFISDMAKGVRKN